jgi:hypothetical protein
MIGTLPACQSPSKKVKVSEKSTGFTVGTDMAICALATGLSVEEGIHIVRTS